MTLTLTPGGPQGHLTLRALLYLHRGESLHPKPKPKPNPTLTPTLTFTLTLALALALAPTPTLALTRCAFLKMREEDSETLKPYA